MASTNEKEIADAREPMYPFTRPLKKNRITTYMGIPSKPGNTIRFDRRIRNLTGFHSIKRLPDSAEFGGVVIEPFDNRF